MDFLQIVGIILVALGVGLLIGGAIWDERPRPRQTWVPESWINEQRGNRDDEYGRAMDTERGDIPRDN